MDEKPIEIEEIEPVATKKTFRQLLSTLINAHSLENESDTPDFILAEYLTDCLAAFDKATEGRTKWYGNKNPIAVQYARERAKENI